MFSRGDLLTTIYSDSTPNVTNTLDRMGRTTTIKQGTNVTSLLYSPYGHVLSEKFNGLIVTNVFDSLWRRVTNGVVFGGTWLTMATNAYDAASRLVLVSDRTHSASYSFLANSPLVSQILFQQSGTVRMTTSKAYDNLNRLISINSAAAGTMSSAYGYNDANERTRNTQPDGSFWVYQYDSLGQVISGKKYWSDWTPVAGQQFEYSFDDIGNRTATKVGGDSAGANLRSATYGANSLNQYTNRTVPNAADVIGVANALATVNVNGSSTYRRGEYYQNALTIDNSATNVWQVISNYATLSGTNQTNVGYLFSPKTPETFGLDADGNQTSDGRWFFTWDGENRLISMVSSNVTDGGKRKLNIVYDSGGRRVQKTTFSWVSGAWQTNTDVEYVYDGWNLIAEVNATNSASVRSFIWGLDLSGSMQGAGGVGGLVAINSAGNGVHFAAYDGNGNVADLINATNGATSAQYEYGPFGEVIRSTGPMAKLNPFRFSTKYQDDESDLLYYGYRYCTASSGRWLNRDPLGDAAFFSQYIRDNSLEDWGELTTKAIRAGYDFVANNPIIRTDLLGLESVGISVTTVIRPPDAQSGVKTIHALSVDEYGAIGNVSTFTGTTIVLGLPVTGVSTFRQWASGSHPKITVTMTVTSHSAALPSGYDIDYNLDFTLDFCSRRGKLSGVHDQYPSYSARVKGGTIYDWQQKGLWVNLWGPGNINPSVSFTF